MDIFAHTDRSQLISIRTPDSSSEFITYPVGAKILVTKLMHNFGGNGANAAVSFSRLGFKTGYVGKIGADSTGDQILASLRKNKVAFLGARGSLSGTSIILDAMGEDRTILAFKGCNNELKPAEVKLSKINSGWIYISSMLGDSLSTLKKIVEYARKKGIKIAFNPSQTIIEKEHATTRALASLSSILVLNKEEAEALSKEIGTLDCLKRLVKFGPAIVVVTDGKNGATAHDGARYYRVSPRKDLKIVETTGAGDAFASSFTAGIMMKKPIDFCMKMAITQSENVIQGHGAQNNLLDRKQILASIANDTRVVEQFRD